ncbi:uncharacterized protein LOC124281165 [Haliotis rubra]|uniref:uncharacterized protein LOC124281165 n=1 Tax=Haliotis rubra TaxID=36100 RepID=UPI001EE58F92|nr:uncharacterized protein LOC124281165 [Haliotis rubra]
MILFARVEQTVTMLLACTEQATNGQGRRRRTKRGNRKRRGGTRRDVSGYPEGVADGRIGPKVDLHFPSCRVSMEGRPQDLEAQHTGPHTCRGPRLHLDAARANTRMCHITTDGQLVNSPPDTRRYLGTCSSPIPFLHSRPP